MIRSPGIIKDIKKIIDLYVRAKEGLYKRLEDDNNLGEVKYKAVGITASFDIETATLKLTMKMEQI